MSWFEDKVPRYEPDYVYELEEIRLQGGLLESFEVEADITDQSGYPKPVGLLEAPWAKNLEALDGST